jgi:hypothetical protein
MAETIQFIADWTPDVRAASDLRSYQYFAVTFGAGGVTLTDPNFGAGSGAVWVLGNKPNSGQACQLVGAPNIYKTVAATTILRDQWLTTAPVSGMVQPGSAGSVPLVGIALMPTLVGCGELVMTKLRA